VDASEVGARGARWARGDLVDLGFHRAQDIYTRVSFGQRVELHKE
jgi:hypothetical protein